MAKRPRNGESATFQGVPYESLAPNRVIDVEYEIPPMRAICLARFADDGQADDRIESALAHQKPGAVIRKITRRTVE